MVAGFTDGYVRFFETDKKNSSLGRCKISEDDYIVELKIMPSGNHILAASSLGLIIIIFVDRWEPLAIRIETLACANAPINNFEVSFVEPYNKFLVGTRNGKVLLYNKRNFNALNQEAFNMQDTPKFNFMDSFNILDYIKNGYAESKNLTLDHFYATKKRVQVENVEKENENECMGMFLPNDMTMHISFIKCCKMIFFRNFELRQVVKRVSLEMNPTNLKMFSNGKFFIVTMDNHTFRAIDTLNEENVLLVKTTHDEITQLEISPNGRYIITGGNKGDIILWKTKILAL